MQKCVPCKNYVLSSGGSSHLESLLQPGSDNQICPTQRYAVRETDGKNSGQVTYVLLNLSRLRRACRMVHRKGTLSMKLSDRQGFETSMGHYFFEDSN